VAAAIVVGALVAYVFGAIYFTTLGRVWLAATGGAYPGSGEARRQDTGVTPSRDVNCTAGDGLDLAGVMGHVGPLSVCNGLISGALVWFGFVPTVMARATAYRRKSLRHLAIYGAYWLVVLLIEGAIIGAWAS
jgi:hypothetical protein